MGDPAERIQCVLDELGLGIRVRTFDRSTGTAEEAAAAIGCALGAIVKSLCYLIDGRATLVLVAGDRRVDSKALRQIYGLSKRQVKIADPDTVLACTGYAVGGVPPIGHPQPLPALIDHSLSRFEIVYAAAGSANTIFPVPYDTLVQITGGDVRDLTLD